eukprot:1180083-Prorocentrum_minimum.AAC.2
MPYVYLFSPYVHHICHIFHRIRQRGSGENWWGDAPVAHDGGDVVAVVAEPAAGGAVLPNLRPPCGTGPHVAIKPLLSHSTTVEFNSPPELFGSEEHHHRQGSPVSSYAWSKRPCGVMGWRRTVGRADGSERAEAVGASAYHHGPLRWARAHNTVGKRGRSVVNKAKPNAMCLHSSGDASVGGSRGHGMFGEPDGLWSPLCSR